MRSGAVMRPDAEAFTTRATQLVGPVHYFGSDQLGFVLIVDSIQEENGPFSLREIDRGSLDRKQFPMGAARRPPPKGQSN